MGSIKTKDIKRAAEQIRKIYPDKFSADFEKNKESLNELKLVQEKRAKNKIAGYIVRQTRIDAMRATMKSRPYREPAKRDEERPPMKRRFSSRG
ncbi:MAG: 30S ribosomal protein S17e [Candidatus Aenigmarchaeota archaeon]|nr:30S ribosomal protein S17e [Candidatus Aenigmarchaeota archaeon]